jgi:RNA polymerase sigma-70 factor, ECF subfamily
VAGSGSADLVARRFATACGTGDHTELAAMLAADAVAVCDGGGVVWTPVQPIRGATAIARFVIALTAHAVLTVEPVNGRAGLTIRHAGKAVAVVGVSSTGAEVTVVWIVLNPEKLQGW